MDTYPHWTWEKLRLEEMVWLRFTLLFLFPGMG